MVLNDTINHIKNFWKNSKIVEYSWHKGRILDEIPDFKVYCVKPESKNLYIYVSHAISNITGCEFFFISPFQSEQIIEILAMLGSFSLSYPNKIKLGEVIDIGRPWVNGSSMQHFLISLPYPYGKDLEYSSNGTRYLWLLPIHKNEYEFLLENNVEDLEQLFDIHEINYIDINRKSVINPNDFKRNKKGK